ncbi:MAG: hypothetical protein JNG84_06845 [Archangium sp.]|nr:hypothetical protein [Archangium sp.]
MNLGGHAALTIVQRKELGELLGIETRNKYEIRDASGSPIGFAAEQGGGLLAILARQFVGHWREYDIMLFDAARQMAFRAHHPFRFFFQRIELFSAAGEFLGALQQRWAFFSKRFDVEDARGNVVMEMRSGLLKVWTFPFFRGEAEVARIEKKWGGVLREAFTDADTFNLSFGSVASAAERALLLAAAIFVDLQYFEKKAQ